MSINTNRIIFESARTRRYNKTLSSQVRVLFALKILNRKSIIHPTIDHMQAGSSSRKSEIQTKRGLA